MTRRQFDRRYRKIRNILFGIMILLLLLMTFKNNHTIDLLIKRNNSQTTQMQMLEQEVRQLETANARLESNIAYQHEKIQILSEAKPEIKINYIAKEEPKVETKQEKVHIPESELLKAPDVTTVIIGTLATLGGLVKSLVPSF